MPLQVRNNADGSLDEIVGFGAFHLEQMSDNGWWMRFEDAVTGEMVDINLTTKRATICALAERTRKSDPFTRWAEAAGLDEDVRE